MCKEEIIKIPITFVNEEFSTFQAAKFLEFYEAQKVDRDKQLTNNKMVIIY
jgi:hypothetical protein